MIVIVMGVAGARIKSWTLASTNIIVTLIIGGVVGWLASILMRANGQMGILANVVIGIVESTMARLRLRQVPMLLIAASLLSAFGIVLVVR